MNLLICCTSRTLIQALSEEPAFGENFVALFNEDRGVSHV
jgi:hypothetical protein